MGFTGREHDESGLNYYRDRYMSPALGRWTQKDRAGMMDGPNVYAYGLANPTLLTDPTGKFAGIGIARAVGVSAGIIFAGAGLTMVNLAYDMYRAGDEWQSFFEYGLAMVVGGIEIVIISLMNPCSVMMKEASRAVDRNGLTKAGRAYQKHMSRPDSMFRRVGQRPDELNRAGDDTVMEIITSDKRIVTNRWWDRGKKFIVDIREAPGGRGVRFDWWNDDFIGFL
jgi:RHS repeat-associated protein